MTDSSKLILVSNRLPIKIGADGKPERTTGGLASALAGAGVLDGSVWVGWPGVSEEEVDDKPAMEKELGEIGVKPVFIAEDVLDGFYEGYSNSTLWPLLHGMLERTRFDDTWYEQYRIANERFADAVCEVANEGDTIWIHDYHLFLLPQMIRERLRGVKIGFFLHTPFPSSEVFRALPRREEMLRGLLGADLLGFHTFNYLRHFRSTLLRVTGEETEMNGLLYDNRQVKIGVFAIGHDRTGFDAAMQSEAFRKALAEHSENLGDKRMVISVERLDYTKGVPQKLDAIRRFLTDYPEKAEEIVFLIIAVASRVGVAEYDQLTEEVQKDVSSINGHFGSVGHAPIQFLNFGFPQAELAALYALSDVALVTPLIDGMNLVAKEYIDCRRLRYGARSGALVLSEFAGAAQEMSHAIQVNPYDEKDVADAIYRALEMSEDERWRRVRAMQDRLSRTDAAAWASSFLGDLAKAQITNNDGENTEVTRVAELVDEFSETLAEGGRAALFLDYDGTLRDFVDRPEDAVPDAELPGLLSRLAAHPLLDIAIVSGRPVEFLSEHLGGLGVTLVGEHGYRMQRIDQSEPQLVVERVDLSWKADILPHLEQTSHLTPGSRVEEKVSALVWHYRATDPEFGLWTAHTLLSELTEMTANLPVEVHHGKKIVEVASQQVNKGVAVEILANEWKPSIALAVGDDQTDESMFNLPLESGTFYSAKVGEGSSKAERRTTIARLRLFLERLDAQLAEGTHKS